MASPNPTLYTNYIALEQEARAARTTADNAIREAGEAYGRLDVARTALFADGAWPDGETFEAPGQPARIRLGDNLVIAEVQPAT